MALEYDRKFEEMKKYIPFLDNMIMRLEGSSYEGNPRQAQLSKIKALRDLLLDNNKRMKMENLNKCEQVLINLYNKVEQSDTLTASSTPAISVQSSKEWEKIQSGPNSSCDSPKSTFKPQLRSVCTIVNNSSQEEVLFHRRPKKTSVSPTGSLNNDQGSRRNYTRILVSPEPSADKWPEPHYSPKPLYHRRSPKKSSAFSTKSQKAHSPTHKKWKKASRRNRLRSKNDISITIDVPDESLKSFSADDIINRIKHCDDDDVDLEILQSIRSQLFHELKETGINPDISNFILKSYGKNKKRKKKKTSKVYEEGELSDSEREYIERVYGNIVSDFKTGVEDPSNEETPDNTLNKDEINKDSSGRKIQINFRILSPGGDNLGKSETNTKESEECLQLNLTVGNKSDVAKCDTSNYKTQNDDDSDLKSESVKQTSPKSAVKSVENLNENVTLIPAEDGNKTLITNNKDTGSHSDILSLNELVIIDTGIENKKINSLAQNIPRRESDPNKNNEFSIIETKNKANFYKPLVESTTTETVLEDENPSIPKEHDRSASQTNVVNKSLSQVKKNESSANNMSQIPFITNKSKEKNTTNEEIISHIDILAALKKDILSENINISSKSPDTPLLHQPKVTKVTSTVTKANDIDKKRRISLEKYKEKTSPTSKSSLFLKKPNFVKKKAEKITKTIKHSRGLTEKECERFNFCKGTVQDESLSEGDKDEVISIDDIYENLGPESPEQAIDVLDKSKPVIIPTESPNEIMVKNACGDTDMRVMRLPSRSETTNNTINTRAEPETNLKTINQSNDKQRSVLTDPRTRSDTKLTPNVTLDDTSPKNNQPRKSQTTINYEVNSSRISNEFGDSNEKSHVYAPACLPVQNCATRSNNDRSSSVLREDNINQEQFNQRGARIDRDPRLNFERRSEGSRTPIHTYGRSDYFGRPECPMLPIHPFGRSDCPPMSINSFGRSDCPSTPIHPFGRADCPSTPIHPFGRSDCPSTPIHPFGRSDCPSTPIHPFGRSDCPPTRSSDCPSTPRHPFGFPEISQPPIPLMDIPLTPNFPFAPRDVPRTPNHPFGSSEMPGTPSHPFGFSEGPQPPFGLLDVPRTPNHQFSPDVLRTPSHPYLASDIPGTPSHPFGRKDFPAYERNDSLSTPSHPYGNSSANYPNARYNRQTDYNSMPFNSDCNRNSMNRESEFNGDRTESIHNTEPDNYRREDRRERGRSQQRHLRETSVPRRENSVARTLPSDYRKDHLNSREPSLGRNFRLESENHCFDSRSKRASSMGRTQREPSMGRTFYTEYNVRNREPSISQYNLNKRNTLDIESHAGRSFTIDTSINRTFQLTKNSDSNFDDRRRRASSVGRSTYNQTHSDVYERTKENDQLFPVRNTNFRRAQSVGRNIENNFRARSVGRSIESNFKSTTKEIFDFETYKQHEKEQFRKESEKIHPYSRKDKKSNIYVEKTNCGTSRYNDKNTTKESYSRRDSRSRNDLHHSDQQSRAFGKGERLPTVQPKPNLRDPRLRKQSVHDIQGLKEDRKHRITSKILNHGIVYTNENITKGKAIGSNSGVKSYKIPKLKRVEEEKKENDLLLKTKISNEIDKNMKSKKVENSDKTVKKRCEESSKVQKPLKPADKVISDNKQTKNNKSQRLQINEKNDFNNPKENVKDKYRKPRVRAIVSDSESEDSENLVVVQTKNVDTQSSSTYNDTNLSNAIDTEDASVVQNDKLFASTTSNDSFIQEEDYGDIDMFADFMVSDAVGITEINQLIAELDKDLDNTDGNKNCEKPNVIKEIICQAPLPENCTLGESLSKDDTEISNIGFHATSNIELNNIADIIDSDKQSMSTDRNDSKNPSSALSSEKELTINDLQKKIPDAQQKELGICEIPLAETNNPTYTLNNELLIKNVSEISNMGYHTKANIDLNNLTDITNSNKQSMPADHHDSKNSTYAISIEKDITLNDLSNNDLNTQKKELIVPETKLNQPSCINSPQKDPSLNSDLNIIGTNNVSCSDININLNISVKSNNCANDSEATNISVYSKSESEKYDSLSTVSTSSLENINDAQSSQKIHNLNESGQNEEPSAPDSTVNTTENSLDADKNNSDYLPDSTNDASAEVNSDVLSLNKSKLDSTKIGDNSSSNDQTASKLSKSSVGNLLTMLQGKSKIKELLDMLGDDDSPETEKIRRKLAKLSEIASDEEDEVGNETVSTKHTNDTLEKASHTATMPQEIRAEEIPTEVTSNKNNDPGEKKETANCSMEVIPKLLKKRRQRKKQTNLLNSMRSPNRKKLTRSIVAVKKQVKPKKAKTMSRELMLLQEDIKEMFISDDVLNSTGIRMCRLAKLVDDGTNASKKSELNETLPKKCKVIKKSSEVDSIERSVSSSPIVVLEVIKPDDEKEIKQPPVKPMRKKPGPKPKLKTTTDSILNTKKSGKQQNAIKYKAGPLSKTKQIKQGDDSRQNTPSKTKIVAGDVTSDSENEALASIRSQTSTELLNEIKSKPKRKRRAWKLGIINKIKKKKIEHPSDTTSITNVANVEENVKTVPDLLCFTDREYGFDKNLTDYACRLCNFEGSNIVNHYKLQHPHNEVPLSRFSPKTAEEAIKQSLITDFQALNKIPNKRHVCRFCFAVFAKRENSLESFFWHVVSRHTGEYKQACTECNDEANCSMTIDMPSPPNNLAGLLLGYICGKCNYTQISLENLKSHVSKRHDNLKTEVYTISLGDLSRTLIKSGKSALTSPKRSLRSNRNLISTPEKSDCTELSDRTSESESSYRSEIATPIPIRNKPGPASRKMQSKIAFETEDTASETSDNVRVLEDCTPVQVKTETSDKELDGDTQNPEPNSEDLVSSPMHALSESIEMQTEPSKNNSSTEKRGESIFYEPHFKITGSGIKEYICCINGNDNHYKTTLVISLKKHIQMKHSDHWDGYCCLCKVIVMPQGKHKFKECLTHFLQNHIDDFPVLENNELERPEIPSRVSTPSVASESNKEPDSLSNPRSATSTPTPKTYLNVRALSELQSRPVFDQEVSSDNEPIAMPRIESVVSLNTSILTGQQESAPKPKEHIAIPALKLTHETVTAEKHGVVRVVMLEPNKLVQIFKCAGKFCSFTSDSAEQAVFHASEHQRSGGEGALRCAYCTFDAHGNCIDLVSHVFRDHGHCRYACSSCFYRAGSASLVESHASRLHPDVPIMKSVLRAPNATPVPAEVTAGKILSRPDAVPAYICIYGQNTEGVEQCKFRTYTPGKFSEHYHQRHPEAKVFDCSACEESFAQCLLLLRHQRSHGLHLYHCTYCVYGADYEADMTAHAADAHPELRPQAYLRHIIETKEGEGVPKFKVLPLVHMNKGNAVPVDVEAAGPADDPVKEVKRSRDLERLVAQTASMALPAPTADGPSVQPASAASVTRTSSEAPITPMDTLAAAGTPFLKVEPQDGVPVEDPVTAAPADLDAVILLQSDEDGARDADVIAISDDDVNDTEELSAAEEPRPSPAAGDRFPMDELYKCAKCASVMKTVGAFKRHLNTCAKRPPYGCAYCGFESDLKETIALHYTYLHGPYCRYVCEYCRHEASAVFDIHQHMATEHQVAKPSYRLTTASKALREYVVRGNKTKAPPPQKPKRADAAKTRVATHASKRKRYGPDDIGRLPIAPILDEEIQCAECGFGTKVRLNMVRHLQQHAGRQPVPSSAPVNPVPHLETNERHFDKMTNLAASSNAARGPERHARADAAPQAAVTVHVAPDAAARFPRFVPERERHACGALGCAYISLDEAMLRRHWETLHAATAAYRCVHCPSEQLLDTSMPLTSALIVSHLKMHDVRLYACSGCPYYHHQRHIVDKHIGDKHASGASVVVVREPEAITISAASAPVSAEPAGAALTMDLRPWHCGLCEYKSMLRAEVTTHCGVVHHSKMQYKCGACPWRGTFIESVTKHQREAHADAQQLEVLHLYYREGSLADSADGTPRWQLQRRLHYSKDARASAAAPSDDGTTQLRIAPMVPPVDLNLVKNELIEEPPQEAADSMPALVKRFGEFCEPRGDRFLCPLCKIVAEESKEAMTAHLYEELNYRKWGCSLCTYKAFNKSRLVEHTAQEHRQTQEPTELPCDARVEAWVAECLARQQAALSAEPATEPVAPSAAPSTASTHPSDAIPFKVTSEPLASLKGGDASLAKLVEAFGPFGGSKGSVYCCPKCGFEVDDEQNFRNHLELELTKVRWRCSRCPDKFHHYHEAQLHCKGAHSSPPARTLEASKDPQMRSAWITNVVLSQRLLMDRTPAVEVTDASPPHAADNSLLVERGEQRTTQHGVRPARRKRPLCLAEPDSDDERLVIDECPTGPSDPPAPLANPKKCPYCDYVTKTNLLEHLPRHYKLKPYTCGHCDFNGWRVQVQKHLREAHPLLESMLLRVTLPEGPPLVYDLPAVGAVGKPPTLVCLLCESGVRKPDADAHAALAHPGEAPQLAEKGGVVYKCGLCLKLRCDLAAVLAHHAQDHPGLEPSHALFKLHRGKRGVITCEHCKRRFTFMRELHSHHSAVHPNAQLRYKARPFHAPAARPAPPDADDSDASLDAAEGAPASAKRKLPSEFDSPAKRIAKKSTSKRTSARKSTTQLPFYYVESDSDSGDSESDAPGYSFYGSRPPPTATYGYLSKTSNIDSKVAASDIQKTADPEPPAQ